MSEASKMARAAMKEKIDRLTRVDPKQRVDASEYTPPDPLDADVKTGARPVSDRLYGGYPERTKRRRGGKVAIMTGADAKAHAGKSARTKRDTGGGLGGLMSHNKDLMAGGALGALGLKKGGRAGRASGGGVLDPNCDVREANLKRDGIKHLGAFKKGGAVHEDKKQDEALIRKEVKPSALKRKAGGTVSHSTGEMKPETNWKVGKTSKGDKQVIGASKTKNLNTADGTIEGTNPLGFRKVSDGKENGKIKTARPARKSGGKAMNVNIIIGEKKSPTPMGPPPGLGGAGMPPPMPPKPMMPPGGAGGPPPGMPPMMGPGGPPPPTMGPPPPMGRKTGGRTTGVEFDDWHASGGGMGRLEKVEAYGKQSKK